MNNSFQLSIVIPVFNEEKRLLQTLKNVTEFMNTKKISCEYLLVNDGSEDGTAAVIKEFFLDNPNLHLIDHVKNFGKGRSVKTGMLAAKGDYILFMDADLSVPIEEVEKFMQKMQDGWDIVIGTRKIAGAQIDVRQPYFREFLGKCFTCLSNLVLCTSYSDLTCGFKMFKSDVAKILFKEQELCGWSFDAEILFLVKKFGFKIMELPVRWTNSPNTKVKLLRDSVVSFLGLIKVRFLHR